MPNVYLISRYLNLVDSNGNIISGYYVNLGEKILVLNIFSQLVLAQYPLGTRIRQSYIQ